MPDGGHPLLDPELDAALSSFCAAPARVVALDFDGVLAPIVPRPEDAAPLPETVAALERLSRDPAVHLGLVSGRALADPALRRAAPPSTAIIGSHGAEPGVVGQDGRVDSGPPVVGAEERSLLQRLHDEANRLTRSVPGSWVERKPTAVVVHTRPVVDDAAADSLEHAAMTVLGTLPGVRAIAGKKVVELSVAAATKGDAVRLLRGGYPVRGLPAGTPLLYVGDDVTDEDAFAALGEGDIGVKVGEGTTRARFRVSEPAAVGRLLTRLADLGERPEEPPAGD